MARPEYFLDTSYAIALAISDDAHHSLADELADRMDSESAQLYTTRAVIYEIGNSFSRLRLRPFGISLINELLTDSAVTVVDDTPIDFVPHSSFSRTTRIKNGASSIAYHSS